MERAAFKFTAEYVEVLGGSDSDLYEEFIHMFTKGLAAARKYATITITMIEIMMFKVKKYGLSWLFVLRMLLMAVIVVIVVIVVLVSSSNSSTLIVI